MAAAAAAADEEELEPLFDYSRVQPTMAFSFDDTDIEKSDIFVHCNKRRKAADADGAPSADEGDKADQQAAAGAKAATRTVDLGVIEVKFEADRSPASSVVGRVRHNVERR